MTTPRTRTTSRAAAPTLGFERDLLRGGYLRLAAVDEVGRGAVAGPVSVGAVIVTADMGAVPTGLRDSKLLTPSARSALVGPIQRWTLGWAVGHVDAAEIDRIGIIAALRLAALRALAALPHPVDAILLDGNHDYLTAPSQGELFGANGSPAHDEVPLPSVVTAAGQFPVVHTRIKADRDCAGVAAASVLAKTARDSLMIDYGRLYPGYGWAENKGYATGDHLAAIQSLGPCELHRVSWRLPGTVAPPTVGDDGGAVTPRRGRSAGGRAGMKGA